MLNDFHLTSKQILLVFIISMDLMEFKALANDCLVGMCTRQYIDLMDELVLHPTTSLQYCRILNEYVKCLDETKDTCRSLLEFHSAATTSKQQFRKFECKRFKKLMGHVENEDRCQIMEADKQKICAFYGFGHLKQLDGQIETCKPSGSQTLVDNKFFLIQLTIRPMSKERKELAIISRITIIFRSTYLCKQGRQYQTDLNDLQLPYTFIDGTNYAGNDQKPSIVIERQNNGNIRIEARHLATQIHIIKDDNRLSVVLNSPEKILYSKNFDQFTSKQMCLTGCPYTKHDLTNAFTNPDSYGNCYFGSKPCITNFIAYDKCQQPKVRNHLHSTCAFDLMYGQCGVQNSQNYLQHWHKVIRVLRNFKSLGSAPLNVVDQEIEGNECKNGSMNLYFGFLELLCIFFVFLLLLTI